MNIKKFIPKKIKTNFWGRLSRYALMFLQWIIFPITMIIFGSIPAVDAQTRLMLGKYMGFNVTEKKKT